MSNTRSKARITYREGEESHYTVERRKGWWIFSRWVTESVVKYHPADSMDAEFGHGAVPYNEVIKFKSTQEASVYLGLDDVVVWEGKV